MIMPSPLFSFFSKTVDTKVANKTVNDNRPRSKFLGVRNIVVDKVKNEWYHLLFFELDDTEARIDLLTDRLAEFQISYILYSTKHGYHVVGLTPLNAKEWGDYFILLSNDFQKKDYAGQTLRLSRKKDEHQRLIEYNVDYPLVHGLFTIYQKRFNITQAPRSPLFGYNCIYEWYGSRKE